ncbi:MAG: GNAT family N-acetyltransferase [Clostridia bacterium]|nr:GNAT family N-acetyltransferase [Clostridia bacterium]
MIIEDIWFDLKDGRRALLRSPREEDIPGTLDYLVRSAGETEFILRYPEECGRYTPELERAVFERKNASPTEAMLMCLVDGRVVGNCDIAVLPHIKARHRATVAIALLQEYWGLGIGTRMFRELIGIAEGFPQVTQLELDFIEGNDRARRLYEKMGFRIAGVHPDAFRFRDGSLHNEYLMIRKMNR